MISIAIASVIAALAAAVYAHRRIVELDRENRRLKSRTEELTQLKRDFFSYISHELKSPLASMQETTHVMLERIPGPITNKQERLLRLSLQSGKRLTAMISNLVDLSRLQAGIVDYDMQEHDIGEIIRSLIGSRSSIVADEEVSLHVNVPSHPIIVCCDFIRTHQLLEEILENALYVSAQSASIRIDVHAVNDVPERMPLHLRRRLQAGLQQQGFAIVCIADSGPGIEDREKENIFQIFHQLKSTKTNPGPSLGLGLAIVRALVEAHWGTIWVEDNRGGGSVFCVLLLFVGD